MTLTKTTVAYILLVAIGITSLVLLAIEVIKGDTINPFVLSLVSLITGFISSTIGNSQGALAALSVPPGHQIVPIPAPAKETTPDVHS